MGYDVALNSVMCGLLGVARQRVTTCCTRYPQHATATVAGSNPVSEIEVSP